LSHSLSFHSCTRFLNVRATYVHWVSGPPTFVGRPGHPLLIFCEQPGAGCAFRDTLQAHPCALGCGHPWPQTVPEGATRSGLSNIVEGGWPVTLKSHQ